MTYAMFATKMVCFIQKLLGRDDDNTVTDETGDDEISSLESRQTSREQQRASCDDHRCMPDGDDWEQSSASDGIHLKQQKLNVASRLSDGLHSAISSTERLEAGTFWSGDSFICRKQRAQLFGKRDLGLAVSRQSVCGELSSSSSSCELVSSSEYHRQRSSSSDDATTDAEPVCCCDACTSIANSNTSYRENDLLLSPLTGTYRVSNVQLPYSSGGQPPSCGPFPPLNQPLSGLPSSTGPVTCSSSLLVRNSSPQIIASTTKEVFNFDHMPLHGMERDLDTRNLPPMICISPDGEEPFAVSQHLLQSVRKMPFSEVPPNKTICHVHCKFVSSK